MKVSTARKAAYDILLKIEAEKSFSSVLLPKFAESLQERDRSLLYALVLGVLRRQMLLDRYIKELTKGKKLDTEVLLTLRLGLFQIMFMTKIPGHSIVNEAVLLTGTARKSSAKGLVNAVLRNALRKLPKLSYADDIERLSIEGSMPEWLVRRWIEQFGIEKATSIISAVNEPPVTAFRLTRKALLNAERREGITQAVLKDATVSEIFTGAFTTPRITPDLRRLSDEGFVYFQDIGSQMIASVVGLKAHQSFLDLCAAPGGKAAMAAAQADENAGIMIAAELHGTRARFLKQNCELQGAENIHVVQLDAERPLPFPERSFDVVLVDAPCSGTGTIGSNPEIRYFLDNSDIYDLQRKQREILHQASNVVKPGGRLLYSTCSLEREENEDLIKSFLTENDDLSLVSPHLPEIFLTVEGNGRIFPDTGPYEGFCIFELQRRN